MSGEGWSNDASPAQESTNRQQQGPSKTAYSRERTARHSPGTYASMAGGVEQGRARAGTAGRCSVTAGRARLKRGQLGIVSWMRVSMCTESLTLNFFQLVRPRSGLVTTLVGQAVRGRDIRA